MKNQRRILCKRSSGKLRTPGASQASRSGKARIPGRPDPYSVPPIGQWFLSARRDPATSSKQDSACPDCRIRTPVPRPVRGGTTGPPVLREVPRDRFERQEFRARVCDCDAFRRFEERIWRLGSESNRRTRLCRPLHNHSATQPEIPQRQPSSETKIYPTALIRDG